MRREVAASLAAVLVVMAVAVYTLYPTPEETPPQGDDLEFAFRWEDPPSMPTPRTEVVGALLDGEVYVIGGFLEDGSVSPAVEVYDPESDEWSSGPPLPQPLHHAGASVLDEVLYVVGGFTSGADGWVASGSVYALERGSGEWTSPTSLPTSRGALTVQSVGDTLYAIGGVGTSDVLAVNEAYSPQTDTWETLDPMPTRREHLGSAVVDGEIYVVGGRRGGLTTNLATVEVYDPAADSWTGTEGLSFTRGGNTAASVEGLVVALGGEEPTGTIGEVEAYSPSDGSWSHVETMPTPRHGLAAVTIGNRVYVVGGGPEPGLTVSGANEVLVVEEQG